jgi:hypothetical protein
MFAVIKFWRENGNKLGLNSNENISEVTLRKAAHINYYYYYYYYYHHHTYFNFLYFLGGSILVSPDLNKRSKRFSPALAE